MNLLDAVSLVLIVLAVGDIAATAILVRAARRVHSAALTERAIVSITLTSGACGVAALALNRLLALHLPTDVITWTLIAVLAGLSLPQLLWVTLYERDHFR